MIYPEQNDEELVALTLAGNLQAYEKLVIRHQRNVIASAYAIAHDHFVAEDAAQEAFVAAWRKLPFLKCPSKYGPWVCRISANCAKNTLARFQECMDIELLDYAGISIQPDLTESIIGREERKMLREIVEKLPERTREVICLHYFEGLSIKDIAEKEQISSGTVKWQLHEGRRKLRKELCGMEEKKNEDWSKKRESMDMDGNEAWKEIPKEKKGRKEKGLEGLSTKVMQSIEEIRLWRLRNKGDFQKQFGDNLGKSGGRWICHIKVLSD